MRNKWLAALALLALLVVSGGTAQAGVRIGIGIGLPCWGPGWGYGYYGPYYPRYYYPGYVYAAPPAVVVQSAPAVVQPVPVVAAQPAATVQLPVGGQVYSSPAVTTVSAENGGVAEQLQLLAHADEKVRSDAALQLGRLKVQRAVDPLAATLAGDRSPVVRETAARALGLIGSPRALTALTHAAQVDGDRDVRRSAQFAVEVIQTNQRH